MSNAVVGNTGPVAALVAYFFAYVLVGVAIARAWQAGRISTRSAALLRAGRWATVAAFVAAVYGWLITPLALVVVALAFTFAAVVHLWVLRSIGRSEAGGS